MTYYIAAYVCASLLIAFVAMFLAHKYGEADVASGNFVALMTFGFWPLILPLLAIYAVLMLTAKGMNKLVEKML